MTQKGCSGVLRSTESILRIDTNSPIHRNDSLSFVPGQETRRETEVGLTRNPGPGPDLRTEKKGSRKRGPEFNLGHPHTGRTRGKRADGQLTVVVGPRRRGEGEGRLWNEGPWPGRRRRRGGGGGYVRRTLDPWDLQRPGIAQRTHQRREKKPGTAHPLDPLFDY